MSRAKTRKISTLGSQTATVVSVALVLLILGLLASLGLASQRAVRSVLGDPLVIVRIDMGSSTEEKAEADAFISNMTTVVSSKFTSAAEVMQEEMDHNALLLNMLEENPFSDEYELRLKPSQAHPDSLALIASQLESLAAVSEAEMPSSIVDAALKGIKKATAILAVLAIILFSISIVLIFNTVSIGVYTRRFVIRTMQLVGATPGFIRRPYLYAGICTGIVAGIVASLALYGILTYIASLNIDDSLSLMPGEIFTICFLMITLGSFICSIASLAATNRYISASYEVLYS